MQHLLEEESTPEDSQLIYALILDTLEFDMYGEWTKNMVDPNFERKIKGVDKAFVCGFLTTFFSNQEYFKKVFDLFENSGYIPGFLTYKNEFLTEQTQIEESSRLNCILLGEYLMRGAILFKFYNTFSEFPKKSFKLIATPRILISNILEICKTFDFKILQVLIESIERKQGRDRENLYNSYIIELRKKQLEDPSFESDQFINILKDYKAYNLGQKKHHQHRDIFSENGFRLFEIINENYELKKPGADLTYYYWRMYEDKYIHVGSTTFQNWYNEIYTEDNYNSREVRVKSKRDMKQTSVRRHNYSSALAQLNEELKP